MAINFSELKKGEIVLLVTSAEKYISTSMQMLKYYCNQKNISAVYVTVNKPYDSLIKILEKYNINTKKIFIIDAITPTSAKNKENAIFIGNPKELTSISISSTSAIKSIPGEKVFFFDSLSTLLIYNDSGSVTKFAHFLVNKMKSLDVSGVIISLEKEMDPKMLSQLSQFVDKVIEVK
ncbi:MAG: ATPase domain-containing protein [Candidatus Nanoarchaeia archaeon]|nr:ATPase domain-containing protein [Candidatus Nanoarchaeia archaeon]MDD5588104.1 ATPase domain-containing protein [Candidatus Nanoarchaeia archaeon]